MTAAFLKEEFLFSEAQTRTRQLSEKYKVQTPILQ